MKYCLLRKAHTTTMKALNLLLPILLLSLAILYAQPETQAPSRIVGRIADLRTEFLSQKSGFHKYGTVSIAVLIKWNKHLQ